MKTQYENKSMSPAMVCNGCRKWKNGCIDRRDPKTCTKGKYGTK